MTNLAEGKNFGSGVFKRRSKLRDSVLIRARAVGIAGEIESMQLALAAMIGGYDQLIATSHPDVHGHIEAAFGKSVEVSRDILNEV